MGNPTQVTRIDPWGASSEDWEHDPTPVLHEPGWRVDPGAPSSYGPLSVWTQQYEYDGTGQLVTVWDARASPAALQEVRLWHDLDDSLVRRDEATGGLSRSEYWFDGWKRETTPAGVERTLESLLPQLEVVKNLSGGGASTPALERVWVFREYDGHGWLQLDDQGELKGGELLGAYGAPLRTVSSPLEKTGFHGMEEDRSLGLVRMGVRHMSLAGDGMWLQPEPLLGLGVPGGMLTRPRGWVGVYAGANPIMGHDVSGYQFAPIGSSASPGPTTPPVPPPTPQEMNYQQAALPLLIPVILSVAEGAATLADMASLAATASEVIAGTTSASALWTELAAVGVGMVTPGGGYGAAARAARHSDDVADAVRVADAWGDASKASRGAGKTFDQARVEAFEKAGLDDAADVAFSKYDEATGTVVEFKGAGGAKVGYDGPHASPGPHHDTQHISWQSAGKRGEGGAKRGNVPYDGPQHPSRPDRKDQ